MARKNLLTGLSEASEAPSPPLPRRRTAAAVGAVGQSIADLRANAVVEIVADQIDHGGLRDRLGEDAEEHRALVESIRTYGQQVPVLVRHSPNHEGRYEAIYGRRRIAALRELGRPVRAMIRDLRDRDLIVVQGQENAARRDLTFIEKANFARQMREAGFERPVICDALHVDKTAISRMLAVADAVPVRLVEAIGPAPGIGRDRWRALGERLAERPPDAAVVKAWARDLSRVEGSDARFEAALEAATDDPPAPPRPRDTTSGADRAPARPRPLAGADGAPLGTTRAARDATTIRITARDGFADWLVAHIDEIHRRFREERGG